MQAPKPHIPMPIKAVPYRHQIDAFNFVCEKFGLVSGGDMGGREVQPMRKVISRKPSKVKKCRDFFCSKECHNFFMRKGSEMVCNWCGRAFYKPPSKMHPENLCSMTCRNLWLSNRNIKIINVSGHTKAHKAPHLTELNRQRNPLCRLAYNPEYVDPKLYRGIMETHLGRSLQKQEVIHHINGVRADNRLENLRVMSPQAHSRLHMIGCN